jgi:hypothetical protein
MDATVVAQCLAFCHELSSSSHKFTFQFSMADGSTFKYCNKEPVYGSKKQNKKFSPCQERRQKKRREDFLQKKAAEKAVENAAEKVTDSEKTHKKKADKSVAENVTKFSCDLCEYTCSRKSALNEHTSENHKTIPQLDGESGCTEATLCNQFHWSTPGGQCQAETCYCNTHCSNPCPFKFPSRKK